MMNNSAKLAKVSVILLTLLLPGCKTGHLGMLGDGSWLEGGSEEEVAIAESKQVDPYLAFYGALEAMDAERAINVLSNEIDVFNNGFDLSWAWNADGVKLIGPRGKYVIFSTVLHFAVEFQQQEVIQWVLDHAPAAMVNAQDYEANTPLHLAARKAGNLKILELLLDQGALLDMQGCNGRTPLYTAAACHNQAGVAYLLGRGADINAKDNQGNTALHNAALYGSQEEAEYLITACNAEMNIQNHQGDTPLTIVLRSRRDKEFAKVLIKAGADLTLLDKRGITPLHIITNKVFCDDLLPYTLSIIQERRKSRLVEVGSAYKNFKAVKYPNVELRDLFNAQPELFRKILDYAEINLNIPIKGGRSFAERCRKGGFEQLAARVEAIVSTYVHQES